MTESDCIDLLWLGSPERPLSQAWRDLEWPVRLGQACPSRWDSCEVLRLTAKQCVRDCVEVRGLGVGVNLPELGQMLLTSSSQVDSLRGKMASNPPGVRAFGLTH